MVISVAAADIFNERLALRSQPHSLSGLIQKPVKMQPVTRRKSLQVVET